MSESTDIVACSTTITEEIINSDIKNKIYYIRNKQVMLDSDLAKEFEVTTKALNQAAKRNIERFPEEFRFQLTKEEYDVLRSQIVTSKGKGGRRYMPYVYTESGIAMLTAVVHSDVAVGASIKIMKQSEQKIFFDGQIFDAFSLLTNIVQKAERKIVVIDDTEGYHIGASLKDAGKKCFGLNKIEDVDMMDALLNRAMNSVIWKGKPI